MKIKFIQLWKGQYAIVDEEVFDFLSCWKWGLSSKGYAFRQTRAGKPFPTKKMKALPMHRHIAGAPDGVQVDHINMDRLDNRLCNLRLCNNSENNRNRIKQSNNKSGFKGVCWDKKAKKWRANIFIHKRQTFLGGFKDKEDAARAYDRAAKKHFGDFARFNFPADTPPTPLS